jgi:Skp family chaperone for outer membrane proteins
MLYEVLQKQSNNLESILGAQAKEFQNFSNEISYLRNKRDEIKSQCENESATLHGQQAAKLDAFVNHFKSDNDGEYIKVIKAVNEEVQKNLSNIKPLLDLAVFSVIQSGKNKLIYYGNFTLNINLSAAMCDGSMLHIGTLFLTSSHAS